MDFNFQDPFTSIGELLRGLLLGWGLAPGLVSLILMLLGALVLAGFAMTLAGVFLTWLDRKLAARIQDRLGPNRVGPFGIFQPIADAIKLITKEDIIPEGAERAIFKLAPMLAVMSAVGIWAVVPFAPRLIGTDLNVGVLYIVAVGAIGTLSIMMGGMASNNKYAMLGAFRTVAQMVAYEIPMVIALLVPTMLAGTMGVGGIVEAQRGGWFIVLAPVATLLFFVSAMAEAGRAPFDLLEAESEIVAGYNVEYSGMKFGMFYVAEFLHGVTIAALTATLFLGGWLGPGAQQFPLLGLVYFAIKTAFVYLVISLIRFSMPRIRIDHLLAFNWKLLTPLALAAVIVTAIADKLAPALGWNRAVVHLTANILLAWATFEALRAYARGIRQRVEVQPAAVETGGAD